MSKRASFRSTARLVVVAPVVALLACNAILGTDEYKVGEGNDGTGGDPSGGDGGSAGDMGTGGRPGTGATTGNGGKITGTGGLMPPGGGPGAGGKGGSGAVPVGTGGSTGSLTADDFIGEWDTDKETQTLQCDDGLGPMSDDFTNTIEWTAGANGTIETYNGACLVVARISGRVATVVPAPPCEDMGITYNTVSGTFTIRPDGTAQMDRRLDVSIPPNMCTGTATGIYTKYVPP